MNTLFNQAEYPFFSLRITQLDNIDYFLVDIPVEIKQYFVQATSIYELKVMIYRVFNMLLEYDNLDLVIGYNRGICDLSNDHRFIFRKKKTAALKNFLNGEARFKFIESKILGCYENFSIEPNWASNAAIDLACKTNAIVVLSYPGQVICHQKYLVALSLIFDRLLSSENGELAIRKQIRLLGASSSIENLKALEIKHSDCYSQIKRILGIRTKSISVLDESLSKITWGAGQSIVTCSKKILIVYGCGKFISYAILYTETMRVEPVGMGNTKKVKELLREFKDYVKYNAVTFKVQ